jgi:hypothetical protein
MASGESGPLKSITDLLIVSAALELGAGLTLLVAPAVVVRLLFGQAVEVFPAVGIARLTGVALLSLGAACFWARNDDARGALVGAMLLYNVAVVPLVLVGALGSLGALQWTAVILHGAMGIWCLRVVGARRR